MSVSWHDEKCETEFVPEAGAWTPCDCERRLAEHDREVRESAVLEYVRTKEVPRIYIENPEDVRPFMERQLAEARASTAIAIKAQVRALLDEYARAESEFDNHCGVCTGHSPSWDGHYRCRKAAIDKIRELVTS